MAEPQCLQRIVRDHHDRPALQQARRQVLKVEARHRVQMPERLVHQDDPAILAKRPREGRPLAHAAGQGVWQVLKAGAQTDFRQQGARTGLGGPARRPVAAQPVPQQDVLEHAEPRQQQIALRHVGDRPRSFGARQQAREVAQQGRLADTAAAEQAGRAATGKI